MTKKKENKILDISDNKINLKIISNNNEKKNYQERLKTDPHNNLNIDTNIELSKNYYKSSN